MSATTFVSPQRSRPPAPRATPPRLTLPHPGDTPEQIRRFRKQRLAAGLRLFALYGFDHGAAGHITVRDPEWTDHFWINPFGQFFGHVRVSDLLLVNHDGDVVIGNRTVNQAGFQIHSAIHAARPEVIGVAHAHSTYGKAWSALDRPLDALTQDAAAFYGRQALSDFTGIVLEAHQAKQLVRDLGNKNFAILKNHGLLTAASSVEAAVWNFIAFDNAAHVQLLAEAAGTPVAMPDAVARFTAGQDDTGFDFSVFSFQPLYDRILREQPDLLD